ncbi:MAG: histidine phosphatase family protein [Chthonomonadales bacterium]|nr:histidine phosphatase family protein [Chthonomonadales bacterium]
MAARVLYLVRHGNVHNPERVAYGRLPGFVLSERGRAEAVEAARTLAPASFAAVYHSPLERAAETAALLASASEAPLRVDERLHEWDRGERPSEVAARMRAFVDEWLRGAEGCAVAVSHRDPIRALLIALEGDDPDTAVHDLRRFPLPTAGIYLLTAEDGAVRCDAVSLPPDRD